MMAKQDSQEEKILNYTLRNLEISEICPNVIDNVIVSLGDDKKAVKSLPPSMNNEAFKKWVKGKGGIFAKDINRFYNNKISGRYILLEGEGERTILRIIEDEELLSFEQNKLVDGRIKDMPYMILKNLDNDESLSTTSRYIIERDDLIEEESQPQNMPHDESEDPSQSMKLFSD